jgi:hypothetical protein
MERERRRSDSEKTRYRYSGLDSCRFGSPLYPVTSTLPAFEKLKYTGQDDLDSRTQSRKKCIYTHVMHPMEDLIL